jgi:hypothetical protein
VRCAVAEPLAARRRQREDDADQIEEERIDQTKHVADDRCSEVAGSAPDRRHMSSIGWPDRRALSFYRAVGASHIRQGEASLAASA